MNILFLSLGRYWTINEHDIYTDLLREFTKRGDCVYILSPIERRENKEAQLIDEGNAKIIKVKICNIQKTNIIEKGISTLLIEYQFLNAIKESLQDIHFDLVLYPTPPITFIKAVQYIKKRDNAKTYLMLKDIFPQNAVDIGMMSTTGLKGFLYKFFRSKEKKLYSISDKIGCMSQANVDYILKHNPEIRPEKVEICPNCIEIEDMSITTEERISMRKRYNIPTEKKAFVYGGNLGRPQGASFIIDCLKAVEDNKNAFFLIVGDGTEYGKLETFMSEEKPDNAKLMKRLPKDDYDKMIAACDIGLIFLDHRFTISNFPSRLLGYMQAGLPVLACTDASTDIGNVIVDGKFGWWCESNDVDTFCKIVEGCMDADVVTMRENEKKYLTDYYSVERAYDIVSKYARG